MCGLWHSLYPKSTLFTERTHASYPAVKPFGKNAIRSCISKALGKHFGSAAPHPGRAEHQRLAAEGVRSAADAPAPQCPRVLPLPGGALPQLPAQTGASTAVGSTKPPLPSLCPEKCWQPQSSAPPPPRGPCAIINQGPGRPFRVSRNLPFPHFF